MSKEEKDDKNLIMYRIQSDVRKDRMVPQGTTIGDLVKLLRKEGYDIKDADVTLRRFGKNAVPAEDPESFVLQYGDIVTFKVSEFNCQNTDSEFVKLGSELFEDDEEDLDDDEDEDDSAELASVIMSALGAGHRSLAINYKPMLHICTCE